MATEKQKARAKKFEAGFHRVLTYAVSVATIGCILASVLTGKPTVACCTKLASALGALKEATANASEPGAVPREAFVSDASGRIVAWTTDGGVSWTDHAP